MESKNEQISKFINLGSTEKENKGKNEITQYVEYADKNNPQKEIFEEKPSKIKIEKEQNNPINIHSNQETIVESNDENKVQTANFIFENINRDLEVN